MAAGARRAGAGSAPRLRRSADIRRALRDGTSRSSERVVLYVAPGDGPARAAWIAGKRAGTAVARNRARRLLREAWSALAPEVRDGYDLVMVARGSFAETGAPELTAEIEELLRRAGLIES
ncbi:MAG TPA: ribonuclease P protein component [Actinomycetota bacterium]|nr:ribonuclease P protein component [Actinomycetota bacterium]